MNTYKPRRVLPPNRHLPPTPPPLPTRAHRAPEHPALDRRGANLRTLRHLIAVPLFVLAALIVLGGLGTAAATGDRTHIPLSICAALALALPAGVLWHWR
jgi:hypothetical protein